MTDNALKIIKDELARIANLHKPQKLENSTITVSGCPHTEVLTKALSVAVDNLERYKDAVFEVDGKIYKVGSKADETLTTIANILSDGKDGK
jgi:hypothetical protein